MGTFGLGGLNRKSTWLNPVATFGALPPSAINGSVAIALDSGTAYRFDDGLNTWLPLSGGGGGGPPFVISTFVSEYDNGNSTAAATIDWNNSQKQVITLTADTTLTFTDPAVGVGNFQLRIVQDATGGWDITWPGNVKWPRATKPRVSVGPAAAAGGETIVSVFWNGSDYYGLGTLDFR